MDKNYQINQEFETTVLDIDPEKIKDKQGDMNVPAIFKLHNIDLNSFTEFKF